MSTDAVGYLAGAAALAITLGVVLVVTAGNWRALVEGADGVLSTSKTQWAVWSAAVVFAYVTIFVVRAIAVGAVSVPSIPPNVLLAMGFSTLTMAAAKGITTSYIANGRVAKPGSNGGILQDDTGQTDLSKVQLIVWTLIAVGIFLYAVTQQVHTIVTTEAGKLGPDSLRLPDIDGSLMVLTGLASGGYIGKKLVTSTTPILTSLDPPKAATGSSVTLNGSGFGGSQNGSQLLLDGMLADARSWQDTSISFLVPPLHPSGRPWTSNEQVDTGVIVNGQPGNTTLKLTVA